MPDTNARDVSVRMPTQINSLNITLIVMFLILPMLNSCSDRITIIGSWRTPDFDTGGSPGSGIPYTFTVYTFQHNGVLKETTYGKSIRFDPKPFKIVSEELIYKVEGDTMTIGNKAWKMHINSDLLQLIDVDGEKFTPLKRLHK